MIYDEELEVKLPPAKTYNVMGKIVNQEKFEIKGCPDEENRLEELASVWLTELAGSDEKKTIVMELIDEIRSWRNKDRRYYDLNHHAIIIASLCNELQIDKIIEDMFRVEADSATKSLGEVKFNEELACIWR